MATSTIKKRSRDKSGDMEQDDDSFEGFSGSDNEPPKNHERPVAKKPKRAHPVQVSAESLTGGAYVGEIYKSNLFKLQVDELICSVKPKYARIEDSVNKLLQTLKRVIEDIPAREPISASISAAEKQMLKDDKVAIPFPEPRPKVDSSYTLSYQKPAHINVAGSYPVQTITQSDSPMKLDLVITMPDAIFQEKDYLNNRYFARRAYYLACIAAGIKNSEKAAFKVTFDLLHGCQSLPVLVLEPIVQEKGSVHKHLKNFQVVVIPTISRDLFPTGKLLPSKSCVRAKDPKSSTSEKSSPFYNATVLHDSLVTSYLKLQFETTKECDQYRDACMLGRVWLRQRGLESRLEGGGFGNFEWATLIALLLNGGGPKGMPKFSQGYSSYQLFKAMLQYIATKNLIQSPQVVGLEDSSAVSKIPGIPLFFDGVRGHNVLFKMTEWSYRLLQHEAKVTISSLGDVNLDQFNAAFIAKTNHALCQYDAILEVPISPIPQNKSETHLKSDQLREFSQDIYTVLKTALTSRVDLITIHTPSAEAWDVERPFKARKTNRNVTTGFLFNPENIDRTVDHGPSAETEREAEQFRKFWGEKAELRRFKDGSIRESLVWKEQSDFTVFRQIISYAVKRHFDDNLEQGLVFTENIAEKLVAEATNSMDSATALFQQCFQAFQGLVNDVNKELEDLSLRVSQVLPADAQLSQSSVEIPMARGPASKTQPANCIIEFESSGRWPDDLEAIQKTKIAFLVKLAESLEASKDGITCRVGIENENHALLNQGFLDVIYPSGAAFRLRIHHDRDATLLERDLKDKTLEPKKKAETAAALAAYKQQYLHSPIHCQAIQGVATRFPSFSKTVRLVKQWFSAQLLSPHFADAMIEMFVASTYTNPYPWRAPTSPTTGLLRTLLFLARWEWHADPWIVNLGADPLKESDIVAIKTRFQAWRSIDPALNRVVMFVASNVDTDGTTWTDYGNPPKVIAARMTALAKSAAEYIKAQGTKLDLQTLFATNTSDYDFVIHINRRKLSERANRANGQGFKNIELQAELDTQIIGYDPCQLFVDELTRLYSNAMVLFSNSARKDIIAGLWNPQTKRSWKVQLYYSSIQLAKGKGPHGDDEITVNKDAILNEIARLGGDLILRIDTK
ncbi:Nrap protein [Microthyrium microscopicum]|uniref:U3 small nucleolar RNA-associated protein 22 n=1 Tax=Microthyrium microscopicum TaxID=703497 RepID=A0A6A6U0F5_9PEZI|nr:Nrap protein [Microthyrium microscopicum]